MTLREAIEHCEELAESCEGSLCGEQHAQLAEWLKDYERLKKLPCIAVDQDGDTWIVNELYPIPPLAYKGNANGWTMYDYYDKKACEKIPTHKDLLVQYWDDTVGIDHFYSPFNGWSFEDKPIACWREIK